MINLLKNKKVQLKEELANQKISEEDIATAQKLADEVLNDHLQKCEKKYEDKKIEINAQLKLIDELLNY